MSESQVKVSFFTKEDDESLHTSDAPLFVPVSLKRYGLSEVVNHLLKTETPVPFDFLIDGVLLRSSVDEYLLKNGLSSETFLNIEYARAVLPPSFLASFNDEDWVSSLDTISATSDAVLAVRGAVNVAPQILAGSYDGIVRTYNMSGQVEKQYVGHLGPVRSVKWVYTHRIVSAGNDRQIRLWKTSNAETEVEDDDDEPELAKTLAILEYHKAPVVDLDVNQTSHRILSAGGDNVVGLWSTVPKDMTVVEPYGGETAGASSASKKRRKMALQDSGIKHRAPLALLESHTQPVEGVIFDKFDSSVAYSVSQDHTIKTWDLVTSRCVDTRSTGYSLLSVLQLPDVNLIASGSSARHINLHDPRIQAGATEKHITKLSGHSNFVVDLSVCPTNGKMFASASHDGTVKVWDVRSEKPLYTISRESGGKDKVFGVSWDKEIGIVSGGEDKKVQINKGDNIAN
ncbi:CIC11C00000005595 [Sungouiella intermedia]|uniref:Ribosome biogenesis protein YTM1 n=1 Tax=Sungouiella intermedia TaxID=45354 RepID=A0A1L0BI91_9ASCO|nr:CIC11C00000005595 [[Candida] intermedia]